MTRTPPWAKITVGAALSLASVSCGPGGNPYERTERIREALDQGRAGVSIGMDAVNAIDRGRTQAGRALLESGSSKLQFAHAAIDRNFRAMRGLHLDQCGYEMALAVDELGDAISELDRERTALPSDGLAVSAELVLEVRSALDGAERSLRAMEEVLPCIEYEHSDEAAWRDDLARM